MQSRNFFAVSTVIATALALSACGPSPDQNAGQPPASSATAPTPATSAPSTSSNDMDQPLTAAQVKLDVIQQGAPMLTADGKSVAIAVKLVNHGSATLSSTGAHRVHVGAHLIDASGQNTLNDLARADVPSLPPNGQETVTIDVPADKLVGNSVAVLPVQEGVAWFDHWGVQPVMVGPFAACASDATKLCDKAGKPLAVAGPSATAQ